MENSGVKSVYAVVAISILVYNIGIFWTVLAIIFGGAFVGLSGFFSKPRVRPIIQDSYWGPGSKRDDDETIKDFKVDVSDEEIKDLENRLKNARFSEDLENTQFQYGFQSNYLKEVVKYWLDEYKWKEQETKLNSFPQFKTQIEGIDVHFIRAKPEITAKTESSKKPKVVLLVHGWPGSVYEFHKIIPILTNPTKYGGRAEDAFEVICPSIPGYGFSEAPHKQGFDATATSVVFVKLMKRLGHDKFYCQGGDWGSLIVTNIATMYPLNVIGVHTNMTSGGKMKPIRFIQLLIGSFFPSLILPKTQQSMIYPMSKKFKWLLQETGYFHIQATKPDTVGIGLNDSPIGLAAYIMEKFCAWTNKSYVDLPDGGLTKRYSLDELLTNVMIYWTTQTIRSSCRYYKENIMSKQNKRWDVIPVQVPAGVACFPEEMLTMPERFLSNKWPYLLHYSVMSSGGHFAAFEEPQALAEDFWNFVRKADTFHESLNN